MGLTKTKHSKPVVVVDMDGVVADFVFSLTTFTKEKFGIPAYPKSSFEATDWGVEWLGLSTDHEDIFWNWVRDEAESFWANERELIPGIVKQFRDLSVGLTWYWCTLRDDTHEGTAQKQSKWFLMKHGFRDPNVVVSDKKGNFCYSVNATHFLDDKFDNCKQVATESPNTKVYFLLLNSQKQFKEQAEAIGMNIVYSAQQFIDILTAEKCLTIDQSE